MSKHEERMQRLVLCALAMNRDADSYCIRGKDIGGGVTRYVLVRETVLAEEDFDTACLYPDSKTKEALFESMMEGLVRDLLRDKAVEISDSEAAAGEAEARVRIARRLVGGISLEDVRKELNHG